MKEVNFLANSTNKQQFINMFGNYLEKKRKVYHAPGDADVLIVQKAVESATLMDTALTWILLCIFFWPEPKKNTKKPKCETSGRN